jgi:hypothetical protein
LNVNLKDGSVEKKLTTGMKSGQNYIRLIKPLASMKRSLVRVEFQQPSFRAWHIGTDGDRIKLFLGGDKISARLRRDTAGADQSANTLNGEYLA